jgi:hypothetical protein
MSKKLIAAASAAALALTALVGIAPASATAATITFTAGTGGGTGTSADPFLADVPYTNAITTATNTLTIVVSGSIAAGDVVTVTSAGTAKVAGDVIATSTLIDVRTLGAATLSKTATSSTPTLSFYVFDTKAETPSTITVTVSETDSGTKSTTTSTKTFEAEAGESHAVTGLTAPASLAASADGEITFKLTDVFGNELDATTATTPPTLTAGAGTATGPTYSVSRKLWVAKNTAPSNTRPFILTLDGNGATAGPSNVGLGSSSVDNQLIVVNNATAVTQVNTLTSQVAAIVTAYNALAAKWNKLVASKRAPKKKVALK